MSLKWVTHTSNINRRSRAYTSSLGPIVFTLWSSDNAVFVIEVFSCHVICSSSSYTSTTSIYYWSTIQHQCLCQKLSVSRLIFVTWRHHSFFISGMHHQ